MIDIEHKVLSAIKDNIGNIGEYLNDKKNAKALMNEHLTIASWSRVDRLLLYQSITNEVLDKYDINEFFSAIRSIRFLGYSSDIDLDMFKAVIEDYSVFLEKVYELYLLDQIYYLLRDCSKDFIMDPNNIRQPLKTNSNLADNNFDVFFMQVSFSDDIDDIYAHLYYNKMFYLDSIDKLFLQKEFLYKKAYLNETLKTIVESEDNYFVTQLFFTLNGKLNPLKSKKKKSSKTKEFDGMQLVLKDFR